MGAKPGARRPFGGPEDDPLFYACFECPHKDCRHDESRSVECPFRIKWGHEHGVDPGYLAGLKGVKRGRGRPRKV